MELKNFVVDKVVRGIMTDKNGSYLWSINQITDPSLNVTAETAEAVDALGSRIAVFNRSKQAEFTANNSIFDLSLYAAQMGTKVDQASASAKLLVPAFEEATIATGTTSLTLKKTPKNDIAEMYQLNGDGSVAKKFTAATTADETHFVYSEGAITLPTNLPNGTRVLVMYEYDSEEAVAVTADAVNFPKAGIFYLDVVGCDVCDQTSLVHAYIKFPNAKLDANVDVTFATDGNHPFTLQANQDYCDPEKKLFQIIIPDEAEA